MSFSRSLSFGWEKAYAIHSTRYFVANWVGQLTGTQFERLMKMGYFSKDPVPKTKEKLDGNKCDKKTDLALLRSFSVLDYHSGMSAIKELPENDEQEYCKLMRLASPHPTPYTDQTTCGTEERAWETTEDDSEGLHKVEQPDDSSEKLIPDVQMLASPQDPVLQTSGQGSPEPQEDRPKSDLKAESRTADDVTSSLLDENGGNDEDMTAGAELEYELDKTGSDREKSMKGRVSEPSEDVSGEYKELGADFMGLHNREIDSKGEFTDDALKGTKEEPVNGRFEEKCADTEKPIGEGTVESNDCAEEMNDEENTPASENTGKRQRRVIIERNMQQGSQSRKRQKKASTMQLVDLSDSSVVGLRDLGKPPKFSRQKTLPSLKTRNMSLQRMQRRSSVDSPISVKGVHLNTGADDLHLERTFVREATFFCSNDSDQSLSEDLQGSGASEYSPRNVTPEESVTSDTMQLDRVVEGGVEEKKEEQGDEEQPFRPTSSTLQNLDSCCSPSQSVSDFHLPSLQDQPLVSHRHFNSPQPSETSSERGQTHKVSEATPTSRKSVSNPELRFPKIHSPSSSTCSSPTPITRLSSAPEMVTAGPTEGARAADVTPVNHRRRSSVLLARLECPLPPIGAPGVPKGFLRRPGALPIAYKRMGANLTKERKQSGFETISEDLLAKDDTKNSANLQTASSPSASNSAPAVPGVEGTTRHEEPTVESATFTKRQIEAARRLRKLIDPENLNPVKRTWQKLKDRVVIKLHPEKRVIKAWPTPTDLCMTMWSYKEVKIEEPPIPDLLSVILSGHAKRISERVFSGLKTDRDIRHDLQEVVKEVYEARTKSNLIGGLSGFTGMRPGYRLLLQILRHGYTQKDYKNAISKAMIEAIPHCLLDGLLSRTKFESIINRIAVDVSMVMAELIGSGTPKPGKGFTGVPFDTVLMGLLKGAIYGTELAGRGKVAGLLATAGGNTKSLIGLIGAFGGGIDGLAKLLGYGGNPLEALGELLNGLNDDPLEALRALASTVGGGAEGIANLLAALGGDKQEALGNLLKKLGGGGEGLRNIIEVSGGGAEGIKNLLRALYGDEELDDEKLVEGLSNLIAASGGGVEGLKNLIQGAGGDSEGIKNLIEAAGGGLRGLKNLLAVVGGDDLGESLSNLIKAAGGGMDGLKAILDGAGGGAEGLKLLLEAVGGGAEGLKNLFRAAGGDPTEALANIIAAAGGGLEGIKNLLEAVGGGSEGLKNLLNAMGGDPAEALANILKAAGGGAEALKNLLEAVGGGVDGLKNLLEALGGDPAAAVANLIAAAGGGEEGVKNLILAAGGGAEGLANLLEAIGGSKKDALGILLSAAGGGEEGLRNLLNAAGGGAEGLKNLLKAAGGGLEGLKNLLDSLSPDDPVNALKTLLAATGGGAEALANLIGAAGGGAEGLKNILDALGGGMKGLANVLAAMGGEDMKEALANLLNASGGGKEGLANLISALGGGADGFRNLMTVLGDGVGIADLLNMLGGGAEGLANLLSAIGGDADALKALLESAGGGAAGLVALLKAAGGDQEALKLLLASLGGGPDALSKLLAMCGDNAPEALRALLESMGGGAEGLAQLMKALGFDPYDPEALKALLQALGGPEAGLAALVEAMGGGKEGVANLIAALGEDGLARIIAAAGGGEDGLVALIKAAGGEDGDGLANILAALGGDEAALSALIAAAGGGQAGLAALLKAANRTAKDGDGLAALVAAAGGGAEGLAALIAAAGGGQEGLANLLAAASDGDASLHGDILKKLIEAGGGGTEGLQNLLKAIAGKDGDPIDGLNSLLAALGGGMEALDALLAAAGGGADALATILAAAGGGAEALQALINIAGGGAEGLAKLMNAASIEGGEHLASILAAAGFDPQLIEAARAGDLSKFMDLVNVLAEAERAQRIEKRKTFKQRHTRTRLNYKRIMKLFKAPTKEHEHVRHTPSPPLLRQPTPSLAELPRMNLNIRLEQQLPPPIRRKLDEETRKLRKILDEELRTDLHNRESEYLTKKKRHRKADEAAVRAKEQARIAEELEIKHKEEQLRKHIQMAQSFAEFIAKRKEEEDKVNWMARKAELEKFKLTEAERQRRIDECLAGLTDDEREEFLQEQQGGDEQRLREEQARLSSELKTAQELEYQTSIHDKIMFLEGLLAEHAGLKRDLNINPAFVWSYFELLQKVQDTAGLQFGLRSDTDPLAIIQSLIGS
ncbi:unnamed protein product [Calicophoron daubneyi]|uniref:Uncharacterized protein n=1 Tax=Calicophoron daubneyi TaxID=300641 RepID=A0AAV2SW66_CALDB